MRTFPWILLSAFLASCSNPGDTGEKPTPATTPMVAPVAAAPVPAAKAKAEDEDDEFPANPAEKFTDGARAFASVRETILSQYYASAITDDDLYRAAVQGMLEHVDPAMHKWNKLLSPGEVTEIRNDLKGEVVGIGVKFAFDPPTGHIDVKGIVAGSPAEKAGIVPGDLIVSVNGKLYKGMTIRDAVADIRGKAGESVVLSVLRDDKLLSVTVRREIVSMEEVMHRVFEPSIGYVSIHAFSTRTVPELRAALDDLAPRQVRAIVVDLRQNAGGSFDEAVSAGEQFLPAGTGIVTLKRREGKEERFVSKGAPLLAGAPIAVLVDHATSSGAELLTAALQEGRHARVVGARTFGKWSVQMIHELPNGYAYKLTSSLFASPSGRAFDGVGLTPDVEVDMDREQLEKTWSLADADKRVAGDVQLRTALALLGR
jgi:carboxyl-terminal processing protease